MKKGNNESTTKRNCIHYSFLLFIKTFWVKTKRELILIKTRTTNQPQNENGLEEFSER